MDISLILFLSLFLSFFTDIYLSVPFLEKNLLFSFYPLYEGIIHYLERFFKALIFYFFLLYLLIIDLLNIDYTSFFSLFFFLPIQSRSFPMKSFLFSKKRTTCISNLDHESSSLYPLVCFSKSMSEPLYYFSGLG